MKSKSRNNRKERVIISLFLLLLAVSIIFIIYTSISAGLRAYKALDSTNTQEEQLNAVQSETIRLNGEINRLDYENERLEQELLEVQQELLEVQQELNAIKELLNEWEIGEFIITAYAPFDNVSGICADDNPNVTSTGQRPGPGKFAVNPEIIPYGSEIIVIGDGFVEKGIAADTGGALRKPRVFKIDLFRQTYSEAMAFGVQPATVFYKPPN